MTKLYGMTVDGQSVEAYFDRYQRLWCAYGFTDGEMRDAQYATSLDEALVLALIDSGVHTTGTVGQLADALVRLWGKPVVLDEVNLGAIHDEQTLLSVSPFQPQWAKSTLTEDATGRGWVEQNLDGSDYQTFNSTSESF